MTFFNYDYKGEFQTVTFEGPDIRKMFYGSFHKVRFVEMLRKKECDGEWRKNIFKHFLLTLLGCCGHK